MGCPRCHEPYEIKVMFDCEITYPFKRGGGNVTYDFLFLHCKSCDLEYAVRDDGLIIKRQFEEVDRVKKFADPEYLKTLKMDYPK